MIRLFFVVMMGVLAVVLGGCTTVTPFTIENQTERGVEIMVYRGKTPVYLDISRIEAPRTYHVVLAAGEAWDSTKAQDHEIRPRRDGTGNAFLIRQLPGSAGVPGTWNGMTFVREQRPKKSIQDPLRRFIVREWRGEGPVVVAYFDDGAEVVGEPRTIPAKDSPTP